MTTQTKFLQTLTASLLLASCGNPPVNYANRELDPDDNKGKTVEQTKEEDTSRIRAVDPAPKPSPIDRVFENGDAVAEIPEREPCTSEPMQMVTHKVVFEAKQEGCPWTEPSNDDPFDGVVTARIEQNVSFPLDTSMPICGIKLRSFENSLEFDDELLLLMDNVVLMSSNNFNDLLEKREDSETLPAFLYNWGRVKGAFNPGPDNPPTPYCIEKTGEVSNCQVPVTSTRGVFKLDLSSSVVQSLLKQKTNQNLSADESATKEEAVNLTLVVTGDDETTDCKHTGIEMDVEVLYDAFKKP